MGRDMGMELAMGMDVETYGVMPWDNDFHTDNDKHDVKVEVLEVDNDHFSTTTRTTTRTTTHDQASSQPTAFHFFPQLPPELRLKIWNLSLPATRVVSIRCGNESPYMISKLTTSSDWTLGCFSNAAIPVNLHVCAESRTEALKSYGRYFGWARSLGHVLFNPDSDILYFGWRKGYMSTESQFNSFMSMCDPAEIESVRRVAVSDSIFWINNTYLSMSAATRTEEIIKRIRLRMPNLREMLFIPRTEDAGMESTMVHERMHRQIQEAIHTIQKHDPSFTPPPWRIVVLNPPPRATG